VRRARLCARRARRAALVALDDAVVLAAVEVVPVVVVPVVPVVVEPDPEPVHAHAAPAPDSASAAVATTVVNGLLPWSITGLPSVDAMTAAASSATLSSPSEARKRCVSG
jgi:hypothetical protein